MIDNIKTLQITYAKLLTRNQLQKLCRMYFERILFRISLWRARVRIICLTLIEPIKQSVEFDCVR